MNVSSNLTSQSNQSMVCQDLNFSSNNLVMGLLLQHYVISVSVTWSESEVFSG